MINLHVTHRLRLRTLKGGMLCLKPLVKISSSLNTSSINCEDLRRSQLGKKAILTLPHPKGPFKDKKNAKPIEAS